MKKINKCLAFFAILIFFYLSIHFRYAIISTYCQYFCNYNTEILSSKNFIVRSEPSVPNFIKHVISLAFPEYNIIYDDKSISPNLIVTSGYNNPTPMFDQLKIRAPYIVYYPEKNNIKASRYRASGHPLHKFLSAKTEDIDSTYIPFLVYSKNNYDFLFGEKDIAKNLDNRGEVIYVFRHCVDVRDDFIKELMKNNIQVDSYGKCLNNKPEGAPGSYNDLKNLYNKYKFVIAMEHQNKEGYITEKIVNAFEGNSIPIFWGSSDVDLFFNAGAFINLNNFSSQEEAVLYIKSIISDNDKIKNILMQNKLTNFGKILFQINKEILSEDARNFLTPIAKNLREKYFREIKNKT